MKGRDTDKGSATENPISTDIKSGKVTFPSKRNQFWRMNHQPRLWLQHKTETPFCKHSYQSHKNSTALLLVARLGLSLTRHPGWTVLWKHPLVWQHRLSALEIPWPIPLCLLLTAQVLSILSPISSSSIPRWEKMDSLCHLQHPILTVSKAVYSLCVK